MQGKCWVIAEFSLRMFYMLTIISYLVVKVKALNYGKYTAKLG